MEEIKTKWEYFNCQNCGAIIGVDQTKCQYCGNKLKKPIIYDDEVAYPLICDEEQGGCGRKNKIP